MLLNKYRASCGFAALLIGLSAHPALAQAGAGRTPGTRPAEGALPSRPASAEGAASSADTQDIVVTGYRRSLAAGVDVKRQSEQFVDAIVASDIGKLPDQSIAESLQRVSGVQIRRGLGEGTNVQIRGLKQVRTEVNGRSLIGPYGRGTPSITNDGAYDILSQIPSELISRLEVTKLPSSDQVEGGLGGLVNIITLRPLDAPKTLISASIEGSYAEISKGFGYKIGGLVSQQFADGRFGVLLNVVYSDKPTQQDSFNSFAGFLPITGSFDVNADGRPDYDPQGTGRTGSYIADLRYEYLNENRKRLGVNGTVQWRPSDTLLLTWDTLYATLDMKRNRNWFAVPLNANPASYTSATFSDKGVLVAGTITAPLQGNAEILDFRTRSITSGLNAAWKSGPLKIVADGTYSRATQVHDQTFTRVATLTNSAVSFDFRDRAVPSVSLPANVDLLNPAAFRFTNSFDNRFDYVADEYAGRLDFTYSFGATSFVRSIEAGVRYSDYSYRNLSFFNQLAVNVPVSSRPANLTQPVSYPGLIDGATGFPTKYLIGVPLISGARYGCEAILGTPDPVNCNPAALNPSFTNVHEQTTAVYGKLSFETDLGAHRLSGNIGVRYVNLDRSAQGAIRDITPPNTIPTYSAIVGGRKFRDFLPSVVAKLDLTNQLLVRAGAARVISQPATEDLSPGLTVNPNQSGSIAGLASGGDPNLKPFQADQFDLSVEWYSSQGAALTMGLFYKDVSTFISTQTTAETVPGYVGTYLVTRRSNGNGGKIKGVELLYQQPFTFLPAPFDGFGVQATYSYIDSSTPFVNSRTGEGLPIEGLSKHNFNLVGYYEKGGFGARLAYNYRSEFLRAISSGGEGAFVAPIGQLDASVRYSFGNFTASVEAANLTDFSQIEYTGVPEARSLFAKYGRRYTFSLSAKF